MQWCEPRQLELKMLVAIGKGIELEVDVSRLNDEIRDHATRTGLRNLLMDAHASATAKAEPENYIKRSRELAEKKLASLYAGVVRAQITGGPKTASDPISQVIMRLARKAIASRPEIAAASKAERLATINRLAGEFAKEHDVQLRSRAQKIVALENDQAEPVPVQKHEPMATKKKKAA
jgi:DNA invertase Pin-like site-specific DNA recombinase